MRIEDQICAPEQAKQLKELGVIQTAGNFTFTDYGPFKSLSIIKNRQENELIRLKSFGNLKSKNLTAPEKYCAFTSAELGMMLPVFYETRKVKVGNILTNATYPDSFVCRGQDDSPGGIVMAPTEATAKADMVIFLLIDGYISVNDVNTRLQEAATPV